MRLVNSFCRARRPAAVMGNLHPCEKSWHVRQDSNDWQRCGQADDRLLDFRRSQGRCLDCAARPWTTSTQRAWSVLGKMKETDLPASSCSHHVADSSVSRPLTFYHIVASLCRMSDQQTCQSGHRSIGGHRVAFLVRTVRRCKPRAAGIEIQRQSLVLPAIAERSLAGPHAGMSGARSGHPQILGHRDEQRPFLC
jgi:hypothetical protein